MREITAIIIVKENYKGKITFTIWSQYNNNYNDFGFEVYETKEEMKENLNRKLSNENPHFPCYIKDFEYKIVTNLELVGQKTMQLAN